MSGHAAEFGTLALLVAGGQAPFLAEWATPNIMAGLAVIGVLLSAMLFLRGSASPADFRAETPAMVEDAPTVPIDRSPRPAAAPSGPEPIDATDRSPVAVATTDTFPSRPLEPVEIERLELDNLSNAARHWLRVGQPLRAASCYSRANQFAEAGRILLALGDTEAAKAHLQKALVAAPTDETVRLDLIRVLLDRSERAEADDLIRAVSQDGSPARGSARFFESAGAYYQATGDEEAALAAYQAALGQNDALTSVLLRLNYLKQLRRLREESSGQPTGPGSLLLRMIDSQAGDLDSISSEKAANRVELAGRETIVGHLALGGSPVEPNASVASYTNPNNRFELERLIAEKPMSAAYEATDRLLDTPVLLKLVRVNGTPKQFRDLAARLRAISAINHPNIAKLTFADRNGPVMRLSMEYLPGGALTDFINRLQGIGPPLIVRMALQIISGLSACHRAGIVHGNLSLDNVMLGAEQRLKITDFILVAAGNDGGPINGTGIPSALPLSGAAVQSDLLQFADVLDAMITLARNHPRNTSPQRAEAIAAPLEELLNLTRRIRAGEFDTASGVMQVLNGLFEKNVPSSSGSSSAYPR